MGLKLAMMFRDGCVLQREKPCAIWGEAAPYCKLSVELQGQTRAAEADAQGKWKVIFEGLRASRDEVLAVKCLSSESGSAERASAKELTKGLASEPAHNDKAEEYIRISVAIGEVWILGGQSNMEFQMRYDHDLGEELESLREAALREKSQSAVGGTQAISQMAGSNLNLISDGESYPDIRFFAYPQVTYEGQMEDYDYPMSGKWLMLTEENLEYFGAVGYYFAKHIAGASEDNGDAGKLTGDSRAVSGNAAIAHNEDNPENRGIIGLVACNWGGTPACAWMDEEHVMKHGRVWREEYEQALKDLGVGLESDYLLHKEWCPTCTEREGNTESGQLLADMCIKSSEKPVERVLAARRKYEQTYRSSDSANRSNPFKDDAIMYPTTREQQLKMMEHAPTVDPYLAQVCDSLGPFHPYRPSGLYHTMLEKVAPYAARGVLWYQGESDSCHAEIYEEVFSDLIENWRQLWEDELPFFCVQLAPFGRWFDCVGDRYAEVRMAQQRTADHMDGVYLAGIADVGDEVDIHPKRKRPVGERLAMLAEKYIYGRDVEADAPRCNGVVVLRGNAPRCNGAEATCIDAPQSDGAEVFALLFSHAEGGLVVHGDVGREFGLYDSASGRLLPEEEYQMAIDGDRIKITTHEKRCRVEYCMTNYYEGNLFNQAGLPVFPFVVELKSL
ncbi:MAG: sialate O-acetylesterase [Clostridiales bacterium]|nr:sialate O-acetylesterase [Clostridiales bacterium]